MVNSARPKARFNTHITHKHTELSLTPVLPTHQENGTENCTYKPRPKTLRKIHLVMFCFKASVKLYILEISHFALKTYGIDRGFRERKVLAFYIMGEH